MNAYAHADREGSRLVTRGSQHIPACQNRYSNVESRSIHRHRRFGAQSEEIATYPSEASLKSDKFITCDRLIRLTRSTVGSKHPAQMLVSP